MPHRASSSKVSYLTWLVASARVQGFMLYHSDAAVPVIAVLLHATSVLSYAIVIEQQSVFSRGNAYLRYKDVALTDMCYETKESFNTTATISYPV